MPELTPTLKDCLGWGMRLLQCNRKCYRECCEIVNTQPPELARAELLRLLPELSEFGNFFPIPEGGGSRLAIDSLVKAYRAMFALPKHAEVTHAICATGTGATVAGLSLAAPDKVDVIGVQAVAEAQATSLRIEKWLRHSPKNLTIVEGHLGGFAKRPDELVAFIDQFEDQFNIPLDPIYNAKVAYKLSQMFAEGYFSSGDKVLMLHTGGLQGRRGISL